MIRVGASDFALERGSLRFGRFDPRTGFFTPVGAAAIPCCGSYGLAFDGTTIYFTAREGASATINTIDPVTGATGTSIPGTAPAGFHVEDMRFLDGTLYASTRNGALVTIDPATGATTVLLANIGRFSAMEVFD